MCVYNSDRNDDVLGVHVNTGGVHVRARHRHWRADLEIFQAGWLPHFRHATFSCSIIYSLSVIYMPHLSSPLE